MTKIQRLRRAFKINWTIGARVAAGFALVLTFVAVVAGAAGYSLWRAEQRAVAAGEAQAYAAAIAEIDAAVARYEARPAEQTNQAVQTALARALEAAAALGGDAQAQVEAYASSFETKVAAGGGVAETREEVEATANGLFEWASTASAARLAAYQENLQAAQDAGAQAASYQQAQMALTRLRLSIARLTTTVATGGGDAMAMRDASLQANTLMSAIDPIERAAPAHAEELEAMRAAVSELVGAFRSWADATGADRDAAATAYRRAASRAQTAATRTLRTIGRAQQTASAQTRRLQEAGQSSRILALAILAFETEVARLAGASNAFLVDPSERNLTAMINGHQAISERLDEIRSVAGEELQVDISMLEIRVGFFGRMIPELRDSVWMRLSAQATALRTSQQTSAAALAAANAEMDALIADAGFQTIAVAGLGLGAIVIGGALAGLIGVSIARPVRRIASEATAIAEGDLDKPLSNTNPSTEIGAMAAAVERFRENAKRVRALEAQKAADAAEAEAERRRTMEELGSAFGDVVASVAQGDFSRRVDAAFDDPSLVALAEAVNNLVATVGEGVAETERVMARVSDGDLSARMEGDFAGAFASLQNSVNASNERLSETIGAMARASAEIDATVRTLTSNSNDLSDRAHAQADALRETSATMEQMSETIRRTADAAASARDRSQEASSRADRGGDVLGDTVSAMSSIESSAGEIGDIISVIDGIAFQTNLLALNAAVEAARAGEAGKGFAIVANEVRGLASRASDAASQIRALVEASGDNVQKGVSLVNETGAALREIMTSVRSVSEEMAGISEATREQADGVAETTRKIDGLDEITAANQRAAASGAEIAATMKASAARLGELIAYFDRDARAELSAQEHGSQESGSQENGFQEGRAA